MKYIKHRDDIKYVINREIALAISNTILQLEAQYEESYQATQHGWFIVCEHAQELFQPLPNLSFSLYEKIKNGEAEYIEELSDWYEIYILLNDNEGVLVFIPRILLPQHPLTMISN